MTWYVPSTYLHQLHFILAVRKENIASYITCSNVGKEYLIGTYLPLEKLIPFQNLTFLQESGICITTHGLTSGFCITKLDLQILVGNSCSDGTEPKHGFLWGAQAQLFRKDLENLYFYGVNIRGLLRLGPKPGQRLTFKVRTQPEFYFLGLDPSLIDCVCGLWSEI